MFPIPDSILTLLLRKLPQLPPDPDPHATLSDTSTRQAFRDLLALIPPAAIPGALTDSCAYYLNSATDGQLVWLAREIVKLTSHFQTALDVDTHYDATPIETTGYHDPQ